MWKVLEEAIDSSNPSDVTARIEPSRAEPSWRGRRGRRVGGCLFLLGGGGWARYFAGGVGCFCRGVRCLFVFSGVVGGGVVPLHCQTLATNMIRPLP